MTLTNQATPADDDPELEYGNTLVFLSDPCYAELIRRWILRILVRMGAHRNLLSEYYILFDNVLAGAGLQQLIDSEKAGQYNKEEVRQNIFKAYTTAEQAPVIIPADTPLEQNLAWLAARLGLSEVDLQILRFIVLTQDSDALDDTLDAVSNLSFNTIQRIFIDILDLPVEAVTHALRPEGALIRCGLITIEHADCKEFLKCIQILRQFSSQLFHGQQDPMSMLGERVVMSAAAKLSADHYAHVSADFALLRRYLASSPGRRGVNILIYGPPGTGKSELARTLANETQRPLYAVATQDRTGVPLSGEERLKAYRLAQSMLGAEHSALVLFDEIEDVFCDREAHAPGRGRATGKKAWFNQLLETNPVPTFWLSNSIEAIDHAILRRFDIVLLLDYPNQRARAQMVRQYFHGQPISERWVASVTQCEYLAPAVIERTARVTACLGQDANIEEAATRIIRGTLSAMELYLPPRSTPTEEIRYRLDHIHTDPPIGQIADNLERAKTARICLYGPSGTGKTAFGKYVAQRLERPLLVKRASDLMSPLLGENEQAIAAMFAEATRENAVLLLDEADSFLQERARARNVWQVTQVNEMLTQMEQFDGLFIASTNFMDSIDNAALRRFDLKVRFDWLRPEQAMAMLRELLATLGLSATPEEQQRISALPNLTPGDFANLLRQSRLREFSSARQIHDALLAEVTLKSGRSGLVRIGF